MMFKRRNPGLIRLAPSAATTAIVVGCALIAVASSAFGQASAPLASLPDPPAAAAKAAPGPRVGTVAPAPRQRSLTETANRAAAPGDLRPEHPVARQISVPLGKTPPPPSKAEGAVLRQGRPAVVGGVDDGAARCDSAADAKLRAACRARLQREARSTPSN